MATWVGDRVAQGFLGDDGLCLRAPASGLEQFLRYLPGDEQVIGRAMCAALRTALTEDSNPEVLEGLEAAEAWFAAPEKGTRERAILAHRTLDQARGREPLRWRYFLDPAGALADAVFATVSHACGARTGNLRLATHYAGRACRGKQEKAARAAVVAALHPWVLLRDSTAEDPPEVQLPSVFTGDALTSASRAAVRALTKGSPPTDEALAREVVEAHLSALGWTQVRKVYVSSDRTLRVVFRARALSIESGGPGKWTRAPFLRGYRLLTLFVAESLALNSAG